MAAIIPLPCRYRDCVLPKGQYAFKDDGSDLVLNVQLRHGNEWHRDGIRLSEMLRKASERPEVLRKLLQGLKL